MEETIKYLRDYIYMLEYQIPERDATYKEYVENKVSRIKFQIELLKDM